MRASVAFGLIGLLGAGSAAAHEPPVVTGMVAGPSHEVVLRTTRGLVAGDLLGGPFSLQCLAFSELLPAESPSLSFRDSRLFVSGVGGLVTMNAEGCDLARPAAFAGIPTTDVHQRADGSMVLLTTGAGMVNDAWTSSDGSGWSPRGLGLSQTLYSALRAFGRREIATGVRIDAALGRPVHFVREIDGTAVARELPIEVGPEGYRVHLLDVADGGEPEALVLVDQYRESATEDVVLRYRAGETEVLISAPEIVDARYGPDGAIYAASAEGLLRRRMDGSVAVVGDGRRATMVATAEGSVFTATEYYIDGCALCRVEGDRLVSLLRFGDIAGPTVCSEAPGVCDADWADWRLEVEPTDEGSGSGLPPAGSGSGEGPTVGAKSGEGCSSAGGGSMVGLALVGAAITRRRYRAVPSK